jgi:alpha-tubulin suppressor-like RCC1 family protein
MPTIFTRGAASARGFGLFGKIDPTFALWSWGRNPQGQLGLNNLTNYSSPKQVGTLTTWATVAGGYKHSLAIKTDGTLWAWGENLQGQLGLGDTTTRSSPVQVGALTTWSKVTAGYFFSLAIKTDGTLWSWGSNTNGGPLGLGNGTSYSSPKQVGALTNWATVSGGNIHVLATKTTNTLFSWGNNGFGQLGLGNISNYNSPKQVGALSNWATVVGGGNNFSLAVKTDGTLWAWGSGGAGNLGLNSIYSYSSPMQVGALTGWSKVAAGTQSSLAIKTNGTLWSWGTNSNGQLGLGNITNYSSPKQIGALTTWSTLVLGIADNSGAIKTDGTLWGWGRNNYGNLGLGNTVNRSSPAQVGALTTWSVAAKGYGHELAIKS